MAVLEEFRAELVDQQMNATVPQAQAMAFRATAGVAGETTLANVHATGVGIRDDGEFVVKVYMFDAASVQSAGAESLFTKPMQQVHIDVEHLPVQTAFDRAAPKKATAVAAANPAQHQAGRRPAPGGVEIGPLGGNFVGTLAWFVRRGGDDHGPLFVLSNNHVLADVNRSASRSRSRSRPTPPTRSQR